MGKKLMQTLVALWMGVCFVIVPLLAPQVTYAQVQSTTWLDFPRIAEWLKDFADEKVKASLKASIATMLINLITFAADRAAYDAAVRISSGGEAEEPLYDGTPTVQYFKEVGAAIAGEAIGLLNEEIQGAGGILSNFNLCAPSSPYVLLQFKLGIKAAIDRPEPKCDFNKMFGPEGTWKSFVASLSDYKAPFKNQAVLSELANIYDPQTNEFSAGLQLYSDVFGTVNKDASVFAREHQENNGFKPVVDFITGNVETPAQWLEQQLISKNEKGEEVRTQATLSTLWNSDLLLTIGTRMGSVFTNTLLSRLQEKIWQGMFDFDTTRVDPFDPDSFALSNTETAAEKYRSLLTVSPLEITNYSILADFGSCPADNRGLYNCVADSSFISAVARADAGVALTINEAIEEGLLDGSWPLISAADVARNQDPYCYTYGYCAGNLVKLRKARVLSVGWELAAQSSANSVESPVTLQEVIDGYNSCGSDGLPDDNHPWCKLIDPNWVLKYPDTQCRMEAYGQLLLTDAADERQQECVDMPSCIAEDENGNCIGGYGYCVAEENVWRFRGESCPEYAASCRTYEDSEGDDLSVLRNTIDSGSCTADNAGCRWYATQQEDDGTGAFSWPAIADIAAADAGSNTYASRIYFNSSVEECDETNGGCSTLVERDTDLRLNVLQNPSFEEDDDTDGQPDGWLSYQTADASTWYPEVSDDGSLARNGEVAISPGSVSSGEGALYQVVQLSQARFYTFSLYARQESDGTSDAVTAVVTLTDDQGDDIDLSGIAVSGQCDDSYTDLFTGTTKTSGVEIGGVVPESTDYERFTCTFTVPALVDASAAVYATVYVRSTSAYIDDIQLEQGEDVSSYHEGYSDDTPTTTIVKVAPSYLGCTGSDEDPEACADYAQMCSEQDVGCTMYAPVNGDPAVTGIATELDACPSECSGYDTYRQEVTYYEPEGIDSVYFIPDTAESCSAEEVGCDEFTNLTTEEQAYFTYVRACVTSEQAAANVSSDNEATFYTWEGSDLEGYQLQTWHLLESDLGSSDYDYIDSDETDEHPDTAPCSNWIASDDGITCDDGIDEDGDGSYDWDSEDCNEHADIFTNSDCREFYDADGNIHYRLWSQTVTVNDACVAYRKTDIAGDDATQQEVNCTTSGGYYLEDAGECRYYGYEEESTSCSEAANGCRAYSGGRSRNSRLVFEELFEDGTLNNWDADSASVATYSNESLASGGHSMLITDTVTTFTYDYGSTCADEGGCEGEAVSFGGTCTVGEDAQYCGTLYGEFYQGKTYTISFVAKGTGSLSAGFDFAADPSSPTVELSFGSVDLDEGWQQYTLGPLIMDADTYESFGDGTSLVFATTDTAYIDNIVLREGEESITVIKDSWVTPASCDESPDGTDSPQYYLGCQEYTTQDGETAYLKSFSSLCDEDEVGCAAYFQTHESETPQARINNATCSNIFDDNGDDVSDVVTSPTACYFFASADAYDTSSPYLCTIGVGENSCAFSTTGFVPPVHVDFPDHITYGPAMVITPADTDLFLVVNDDVTCNDEVAGCTEFGNPTWSQDRNSTTGADSIFLYNLPDEYESTLCTHEELFCDAFSADDGDTDYFKHPLDQMCEYRTDVTIAGTVYDGWFRAGTDEFCYGTCEDTSGNEGAACGSSADCSSDETCDATNPSYVIGGTESGIWRNGDDAYAGWAGSCSATYDSCSEFQDVLAQDDGDLYGANDGTSYFYLNDDTLSENYLADSEKCEGQVSLKKGCAMFYDTAETSMTANASATEISSQHADVVYGQEPFALVDPIDCDNGGDTTVTTTEGKQIDLCATRCVYDYGELYDLSNENPFGEQPYTYQKKLSSERTILGLDFDRDDLYVFGGSCMESTDCPTIRSESGDSVEAISCSTQVRVDPYSSGSTFGGPFSSWTLPDIGDGFSEVPRLENDVNSVLKVNRDRQCSEWLACSDAQTQWDENTGSFKTTCNDIALCTGYSATSGSTFCADWDFNKPDVVFDEEWYTSRDISWYGNDYSGMAVPNLFPVQSLTQANVAPEFITLRDIPCEEVEGTCIENEEVDYQLVLNAGECTQDFGESCAIGYCSDTGATCANTSDCLTGTCYVGSCYDIDAAAICATAADCSEGQTCYGGACADIGADVDIDEYSIDDPTDACDTGEIFVPNTSMKLGSCINDSCLLTPEGETFETGTTEGKLCRAYPEANSPFPEEIVESWYDPRDPGTIDDGTIFADALPYDVRSGYEQTMTCANGEDCDCSYTKVSYGQGAAIRYYNQDWSASDIKMCNGGDNDGNACASSADCMGGGTCEASEVAIGICQGGADGAYCLGDEDCGEGICSFATREDVIYGLNGFCLEKDSSINLHGDRDKNACLTWLPVDELAGDTDLQGKYIEAGYDGGDTFYCSYLTMYVDVGTSAGADGSDSAGSTVACSERDKGADPDEDGESTNREQCLHDAFSCPAGFYAIVGDWYEGGSVENEYANYCKTDGDNDCPFVCVPHGSFDNNGEGESCEIEENSTLQSLGVNWDNESSVKMTKEHTMGYTFDAYFVANSDRFVEAVAAVQGCVAKGRQYGQVGSFSAFGQTEIRTYDCGKDDCGYRNYQNTYYNKYLGCRDYAQVNEDITEDTYNAAPWTDRLWELSKENYTLDVSDEDFSYAMDTSMNIFGATRGPEDILLEDDPRPSIPLQCQEESGTDTTFFSTAAIGGSCDSGSVFDTYYSDISSAEALPFYAFSTTQYYETSSSGLETDFTNVDTIYGGETADKGSLQNILSALFARSISEYRFDDGVVDPLFVDDETTERIDDDVTVHDTYGVGDIAEIDGGGEFGDTGSAAWDTRATEGNAPTIWSVNTSACTSDNLMCEEGVENRITINSTDTGNQSAEGFFYATVKFYAAADKNQLPLRRMIIDWQDSVQEGTFTGSSATDNFYKNARGLEDGTEISKCDSEDEWGMTSDSCDPYYFSYNHIYTCPSEVLRGELCEDLDADGNYDNFPCALDQTGDDVPDACAYQPRVHIRDNWGWCTGTCTGGSADGYTTGTGCFDGDAYGIFYSLTGDECEYSGEDLDAANNPWVNYDGVVIVSS